MGLLQDKVALTTGAGGSAANRMGVRHIDVVVRSLRDVSETPDVVKMRKENLA